MFRVWGLLHRRAGGARHVGAVLDLRNNAINGDRASAVTSRAGAGEALLYIAVAA